MKHTIRVSHKSPGFAPTWQNLCTITFSLLAATPAAQAASATWSATPADNLWSTEANWSTSPVPGVGDTATFGASSVTTIDTGAISLSQLVFNTGAPYTIGGASAGTGSITFADGTTTATNLANPGQANLTINANIILGTAIASNTTFTSAINRTTTLAGSISGGTGGTAAAKTLTLSPTSNSGSVLTISGAISDGGATSLAVSKGGTGTVNLTNASNSFTGGLTVTSGTVNVSSLGALGGATTGLIALGTGNQSAGILNFTGSPGSLSRQVQLGNPSAAGSGSGTITNNAANGSTPLIFTNAFFNTQINNNSVGASKVLTLGGANTDANEIQGIIRNNIGSGATIAVTKAGAGTWTLSGANTYTGATTISGGTLALGANDVLPDATPVSLGAATLNAATFDDTVGTLDVTGSAVINLGSGANLTFAASDLVDWTGGTLDITGTFVSGSSLNFGSPTGLTGAQLAAITSPGFSAFALDSSGFLTATGGSNTYANWLTLNSPATGFVTDSDNDGIPNGVENVLGSNPNTYNAGLTEVSATSTSATFKHTLNPTIASDVTYSYQWSTDLVEWKASTQTNTGGTTATIVASPPALGVVTVTITITGGSSAKVFGRLVAVN